MKDKHMMKGTSLLLLAALLLAVACLVAPRSPMAAALEPTDSGAPSAIVIFPVGAKPNTKVAAMPPVAFNHVIHEKWMSKSGKDCLVCHHTGDPVACTTCHTVDGKAEGKFITLYKAMHNVKVGKKAGKTAEGKPSSCVSCHIQRTSQRECAGCHTQLVKNARNNDKWCAVCHTITPSMTQAQLRAGIENKLPARQNEYLGAETAMERKQTQYWSPMTGPYKVNIDELSGKYEPCLFNHRHHVSSLMDRIKNSKLAGAFHTSPATICITCHHHSPASATPPKCSSCHSKTINPKHPERPVLMAAYHLQCMGCHKDMKVARPRNTDCETCHKLKPVKAN